MACNEVLETDAPRRRLRALRPDVITVAQLRMLRQRRHYPDGPLTFLAILCRWRTVRCCCNMPGRPDKVGRLLWCGFFLVWAVLGAHDGEYPPVRVKGQFPLRKADGIILTEKSGKLVIPAKSTDSHIYLVHDNADLRTDHPHVPKPMWETASLVTTPKIFWNECHRRLGHIPISSFLIRWPGSNVDKRDPKRRAPQ